MGLVSVFIKKEKFGTRDTGKTPCEHQDIDQGDVSASQEMPEVASKPPESRTGAWNRFSLMALKGSKSANTLLLDFCTWNLRIVHFHSVSPISGTLLGPPWQANTASCLPQAQRLSGIRWP